MTQSAVLKLAPPANDLQERAAAAREELERLKRVCAKADSAATEALAAFTKTPNAETHSASAVAEQVAKNARQAFDEYEIETRDVLGRASREVYAAELDAIRKELRSPVGVDGARQCMSDLLVTIRREFRATVGELYKAVAARNERLRRAQYLSDTLGLNERFGFVSIDNIVGDLAATLNARQPSVDTDTCSLQLYNPTGDPRLEKLSFVLELIVGDLFPDRRMP